MTKTEKPIDGASVQSHKLSTLLMTSITTKVPTDGVGVLRRTYRWRHVITLLLSSYPPSFAISKTEVPTDGVSVCINTHLTLFMINVPTDGVSLQYRTRRWRQSISPSLMHAYVQDRNANRWRSKPNYHHIRVDWPIMANITAVRPNMMLLSSRPWVHGPFSMLHTFARSPWLQPAPFFFPLQDPELTSCMWCMCTLMHVRVAGEPSKTEVHKAPPSDALLRREGWCLYPTNRSEGRFRDQCFQ